VLTASLLAAAQLFEVLWWLAVPGILLLVHVIQKTKRPRQLFWFGWLIGSANALAAIAWFWSVYPLDWLGLAGNSQLSIIGAYWLITGLVMGLGFGISLWLYKKSSMPFWTLPGWLLLGESLGAFLFSMYSYGYGSYFNTNFSFGWLGYLVAEVPILQSLAAFGGVYLLSLWLCVSAVILWYLTTTQNHKRSFVAVGLLVLIPFGTHLVNQYQLQTHPPTMPVVIAIDTLFDPVLQMQSGGWAKREATIAVAVDKALAFGPRTILLSEDAHLPNFYGGHEATLEHIKTEATAPVQVITSAKTTLPDNTTTQRGYVYDTNSDTVFTVDKQYLVPQGEYISYFYYPFLKLFAGARYQSLFGQLTSQPGPHKSYDKAPEATPALLFCMESVAPRAAWSRQRQYDTPYLVHLISHSWFNEPTQLWRQLDRMLQVQALWTGVPIVSAGNLANGKLYLSNGRHSAGTVLFENEMYRLTAY